MKNQELCRGCKSDRDVHLYPFCSFCAQMWRLSAEPGDVALESDNPTARLLARQALRYKAQRDTCLRLLEQWSNRYLGEDDSGKGSFDDSEPEFADLLHATERLLLGDDEPGAKFSCPKESRASGCKSAGHPPSHE